MEDQRTHYAVLGVAHDAALSEIRASWKLLVRVWHPDRHSGEIQLRAERETALINGAWATLRDPARRRRYDTELELAQVFAATGAPEHVSVAPRLGESLVGLLRDMVLIARRHPRAAAIITVVWLFLFSGAIVQQVAEGPSGPAPAAAVSTIEPAER